MPCRRLSAAVRWWCGAPMAGALTCRPMRRPELDLALDWAAAEGWNPGLRDADAFWAADPEGFWLVLRFRIGDQNRSSPEWLTAA